MLDAHSDHAPVIGGDRGDGEDAALDLDAPPLFLEDAEPEPPPLEIEDLAAIDHRLQVQAALRFPLTILLEAVAWLQPFAVVALEEAPPEDDDVVVQTGRPSLRGTTRPSQIPTPTVVRATPSTPPPVPVDAAVERAVRLQNYWRGVASDVLKGQVAARIQARPILDLPTTADTRELLRIATHLLTDPRQRLAALIESLVATSTIERDLILRTGKVPPNILRALQAFVGAL